MKKIISALLALVMMVSLAVPAFAAESQTDDPFADITLDVSEMSEEELAIYNEVMNRAIAEQRAADPNFNEEEFVSQVNSLLYMMEHGVPQTRAIIDLSVPNSAVTAALDVALSLAIGGATGAAVKALVAQFGKKIAIQKITSAAIGALAAFGVKQVLDLDGIVTNIVENLLSPGTAIAEWLDSTDPEPNNGYWDIVLG
ncbi:hypothetical protein H9X85_04510 [Anaerotignum lactatifermentans]|jgi:hypothetical protein|uniref:Uncharacterized protein n=1 Tax=Anaerotignum lactatifermentans TaxID=160404 RepID=A0ABS2G633_9FIRM|nr:hypothetical protein [Anaerotignum lactatifermentans]MBM6828912.1 hypothetical protein [Anaerotignum lactatifermentans]MBM6876914.1 hypothetical protein [Anaerotignum lactatifermentans]MBM6950473.1 hypothetical protein [Anaerotignum lactatifermentans]